MREEKPEIEKKTLTIEHVKRGWLVGVQKVIFFKMREIERMRMNRPFLWGWVF